MISGSGLQGMVQEVEHLRREVDKLKHCGETDLGVTPPEKKLNSLSHLALLFLLLFLVFLIRLSKLAMFC